MDIQLTADVRPNSDSINLDQMGNVTNPMLPDAQIMPQLARPLFMITGATYALRPTALRVEPFNFPNNLINEQRLRTVSLQKIYPTSSLWS